MRAGAILVSLCAIATYTADVWAQADGPKVRVRDSSGILVTGTLVSLDSATLVVRTAVLDNRGKWSERDSTIPVTADIRLDRSLGRRGNGGKGALIGFGVGMGLTLLAVIANAADDNPDDYVEVNPGAILLGGTIMFGGAGALIGYGIGSAHRRDVWAEVPLDLPPQGDPYGMTDGMMRLGLRIDF